MRRLAICIGLALSLASTGAALAKQPVKAKVCGPAECRTVTDHDQLMTLPDGGPPTDPPDRGAEWYSVRMTVEIDNGRRDSWDLAVVPSAGLLRAGDGGGYTWMPATDSGVQLYRRVTRGLAPFPAAALKGVGAPRVKAEPEPKDASSPLPWIAGGVALLALAGLLIRRRGLPWPKPAQG